MAIVADEHRIFVSVLCACARSVMKKIFSLHCFGFQEGITRKVKSKNNVQWLKRTNEWFIVQMRAPMYKKYVQHLNGAFLPLCPTRLLFALLFLFLQTSKFRFGSFICRILFRCVTVVCEPRKNVCFLMNHLLFIESEKHIGAHVYRNRTTYTMAVVT